MTDQDSQNLDKIAQILAAKELPKEWQLVGSSAYARVAFNQNAGIYYKEFLPRSLLESVKAMVKGSRATRARKHNDILREAGFPAPNNLAWGKLPGAREYLFSSAVPGQGVTSWLREDLAERSGKALQKRRSLLYGLGEFIGKLHASGFIHGDLRTSNVLAEEAGESFNYFLIDNERNKQQRPAAGRDVLRNLMQLNMLLPADVTNTDRMRVFVKWREQMTELNTVEAKLLAIESWRWAMKRLNKKGLL